MAVISVMVISACSSRDLSENGAPDFRLSIYNTFAFGDMADTSSEDLRFRSAQFEDRVKSELRFVLPQRGLEQSNTEPELLIYFFTLPEKDEDFQPASIPYTRSMGVDISDVPVDHNFVIDFVDRRQNVLMWRTSGEIDVENSEQRNRMLPGVIKEMLENIPS